jgi:hypothetical protein
VRSEVQVLLDPPTLLRKVGVRESALEQSACVTRIRIEIKLSSASADAFDCLIFRQVANPYGLQRIDIVKRETSVLSGVPRVRGASNLIVLHAQSG